MKNNFSNYLIRIGIIGIVVFLSVGEVNFLQIHLREYIHLPLVLLIIGSIIQYNKKIISKFKKIPLTGAIIIGAILCCISIITSINRIKSIKVFLFLLIGIIALYFLIINLTNKREMEIFIVSLFIGFIYIGVVGIYQYFYFFCGMRIYSTWEESNQLGYYLTFVLPIFCGMALSKKGIQRIIFGGAFLWGKILLLWTYSRSAWIATLGALIFLLTCKKKKLFLLILIGMVVLTVVVPSSISARIRTIFQMDSFTNKVRISIWKSSIEVIKKHPLTGVGIGVFYKEYPHSCHNFYLEIATNVGIWGLIPFIYGISILFRRGIKFLRTSRDKFWVPLVENLLASLVGALILGMFEG